MTEKFFVPPDSQSRQKMLKDQKDRAAIKQGQPRDNKTSKDADRPKK